MQTNVFCSTSRLIVANFSKREGAPGRAAMKRDREDYIERIERRQAEVRVFSEEQRALSKREARADLKMLIAIAAGSAAIFTAGAVFMTVID